MQTNFWKDKFEFLFVSLVFLLVFSAWMQSGYRPDIKEFLIAVFGAWLALLRVVQKPAALIGRTDSGDVTNVIQTTSATPAEGNQNANPND